MIYNYHSPYSVLCFTWLNKPLRIGVLGSRLKTVKTLGMPVCPYHHLYSGDHPGIWLRHMARVSSLVACGCPGRVVLKSRFRPNRPDSTQTNQATKPNQTKPNQIKSNQTTGRCSAFPHLLHMFRMVPFSKARSRS